MIVSTSGRNNNVKCGLVLSGGGARAAYQVGVLKAIAEMHPKQAHNPFSVITGTSAGAINAVALAASANNFRLAVRKVEKIWTGLTVDQVHNIGSWAFLAGSSRLLSSLLHQGIGRKRPVSLLNNDPLRELLTKTIQFKNIEKRIDGGFLDAVAVSATGYSTGEAVAFYQGNPEIENWCHNRCRGIRTKLETAHLLASSAIPMVLPAERLSREYFGDGALRQKSPLNPALIMGANRLLVIGVSANKTTQPRSQLQYESPSLAKMFGHVFNSAFLDNIENDIDHLMMINDLLGMIENETGSIPDTEYKPIDLLTINPSIEIDKIAEEHIVDLPRSMRFFMRMLGVTRRGGGFSLASYVLFDKNFCKRLINLGYQDAMEEENEIRALFLT